MTPPNNMRTGITLGTTPENYFPESFFVIYLIFTAILRRCGFKDCILYLKHSKRVFNQEIFDTGVLFNLYSDYGVGKSLEPLIYELFSTIMLDPETNRRNIFYQEIVRLAPEAINIIRTHNPTVEINWMMGYAIFMEPIQDNIANERILRMSDLLYEIPPSDDSYDSDDSDDFNPLEDSKDSKDSNNYVSVPSVPLKDSKDSKDSTDYVSVPSVPLKDSNNSTDYVLSSFSSSFSSSSDPEDNDRDDNNHSNNSDDQEIMCYCLFCHEFRKYHTQLKTRNMTQMINKVLMTITRKINRTL